MGLYGPKWGYMWVYGAIWAYMGPYVGLYGAIWPIWGYVGLYGPIWAYMGRSRPGTIVGRYTAFLLFFKPAVPKFLLVRNLI